MSPISKFEAIGIFMSVAVMAMALTFIRFNTNLFIVAKGGSESVQTATVIATGDANADATALGEALFNAATSDGELAEMVIDDIKIGTGKGAETGDVVVAHYIGSTRDGVQFDSSYVRGTPFEFTIGDKKVIEGWEKGLIGMKVGGQRILVIPPQMAYGNRQVGPIPPNSPLVFAIELLEIK